MIEGNGHRQSNNPEKNEEAHFLRHSLGEGKATAALSSFQTWRYSPAGLAYFRELRREIDNILKPNQLPVKWINQEWARVTIAPEVTIGPGDRTDHDDFMDRIRLGDDPRNRWQTFAL